MVWRREASGGNWEVDRGKRGLPGVWKSKGLSFQWNDASSSHSGRAEQNGHALNSTRVHTPLCPGSLPSNPLSSAAALQKVAGFSESCPYFIFPQQEKCTVKWACNFLQEMKCYVLIKLAHSFMTKKTKRIKSKMEGNNKTLRRDYLWIMGHELFVFSSLFFFFKSS